MKKRKFELRSMNGYPLDEIVSAIQKEIRRGKEKEAIFWGFEMAESGFGKYLWRRLFIIASEDVSPKEQLIPSQVWSLYRMTEEDIKHSNGKSWKNPEPMFFSKAIMLLCRAKKNRLVDLAKEYVRLKRKKGWLLEVPIYAVDKHTKQGKKKIKQEGLNPLEMFYNEGAKVENYSAVKGEETYLKEVLKLNNLD